MDQALLDGGYRCYTGENIDVYFNTAICQHSGNCVRGNGKLFNLKRKPWIMPDEVDVTTVVKVIDTCPSGALKYRIDGKRYRSMTSLGKNVTFGGTELRLEANIFDFEGDIYGKTIEVFWLDYIRDMIKFNNIDELCAQLEADKKIAEKF